MFAQDFLEQIITEPTKGTNILDLGFSSHSSRIHQYRIVPGQSDHDAIFMDMFNYDPRNSKLKKKSVLL